ncbi:class I SAM-dependent methyltransferase [Subtercola sp. YIM 133946]|uniref:class I SAM-dependent methyltransferase n=1 Tax=Subtercola sp. YIM 133946 TaxID=3118909 RepID=UPI002F938B00
MSEENPTLTMIRKFVSIGRAELPGRPHTVGGDPDAQRALVFGMQAVGDDGTPIEIGGALLDLLAPRAPYFDQLVVDAITSGVTQIVNIGVGFDDRALRFRDPHVTFFEIDLAHVIDEKRSQLEKAGADQTGLVLAAADLHIDDIGEVLNRAGHDRSKPSLFLAEHLFLFLEQLDVEILLTGMAGSAAPGSVLAVTAEVHPEGFDSAEVLSTADQVMFGGTSPLHTILSRETWLTLFADSGWTVKDVGILTAVDHFAVPVDGQTAQIQTQFLTATI